jgi:hypothetical protein
MPTRLFLLYSRRCVCGPLTPPSRFFKSDSPRIVCLTALQSEIVLSFDCTLSSLKMIVIVSLP